MMIQGEGLSRGCAEYGIPHRLDELMCYYCDTTPQSHVSPFVSAECLFQLVVTKQLRFVLQLDGSANPDPISASKDVGLVPRSYKRSCVADHQLDIRSNIVYNPSSLETRSARCLGRCLLLPFPRFYVSSLPLASSPPSAHLPTAIYTPPSIEIPPPLCFFTVWLVVAFQGCPRHCRLVSLDCISVLKESPLFSYCFCEASIPIKHLHLRGILVTCPLIRASCCW